jgi:hypothetical protein
MAPGSPKLPQRSVIAPILCPSHPEAIGRREALPPALRATSWSGRDRPRREAGAHLRTSANGEAGRTVLAAHQRQHGARNAVVVATDGGAALGGDRLSENIETVTQSLATSG